jgi:hypothetical protein
MLSSKIRAPWILDTRQPAVNWRNIPISLIDPDRHLSIGVVTSRRSENDCTN